MMKQEILDLMTDVFPKMMLKGNFNTWVLKCPFHHDHREKQQFFIDVKTSNYYCIGCGTRGKIDGMMADLAKHKKKNNPQD